MRCVAFAAAVVAAIGAAGCAEKVERLAAPGPPAFSPLKTGSPFPPLPSLGGEIPGQGLPAAYLTRTAWLHATPGGRRLVRVKGKTEFGSPRVFAVVHRRGPWVAVMAAELNNGYVGWLDARQFTRLYRIPYTIDIDLSRRRMTVSSMGHRLVSTRVAIGMPSAPTPKGTFAITDKLLTGEPDGPYGCCALALTAHQPHIPQGWGGGDRIAIHATPSPETIGQPVSHGCLRASTTVMKRLVYEIPLGSRVRIHD